MSRGRVRADRLERPFQGGHPLGVDTAETAENPTLVGQGGAGGPVGVAVLVGQSTGLQQRLPVGGVSGAALGLAEHDEQLGDLRSVAGLAGGARGAFEVVGGLLVGQRGHGPPAGLFGVAGGLGHVVGADSGRRGGGQPMVGEIGSGRRRRGPVTRSSRPRGGAAPSVGPGRARRRSCGG